jgi:hypothetical protein
MLIAAGYALTAYLSANLLTITYIAAAFIGEQDTFGDWTKYAVYLFSAATIVVLFLSVF